MIINFDLNNVTNEKSGLFPFKSVTFDSAFGYGGHKGQRYLVWVNAKELIPKNQIAPCYCVHYTSETPVHNL